MFRVFLLIFILLFSFSYSAESDVDVSLSKEFKNFWSGVFSHKKKKGKFTDKLKTYQGVLYLNGMPIEANAVVDPYNWKLSLYDPNDVLMTQYHVPFLVVGYEMDGVSDVYYNDLGKTQNFSGKELVALALSLKETFKISEFILIDDATSVKCPGDGFFCNDEAVMSLRHVGTLLTGKSYYESLGAHPNHQMEGYRDAVDFVRSIKVADLLEDLKKMEDFHSNHELVQILQEAMAVSSDFTLQSYASYLKEMSKKDVVWHSKWHRFHNHVIANKGHSLANFTQFLTRNKWVYDQNLIKGLSFIVYADIRMSFNELMQYLKVEKEKKQQDPAFIQEGEYILDSYPNLYGCSQKWCRKKNIELKLNEVYEKPSVFALFAHASATSIERFLENYEFLEPVDQSEKIFNDCVDALKYLLKKNDEKAVNYRKTYLQVIENYRSKSVSEHPPGTLYGAWMYSKWIINLSNAFEFGAPEEKSKGGKGDGSKGWFRPEVFLYDIASGIL